MITRQSILRSPSMRQAYDAILLLEKQYLKDNKRKHTIELALSSTSTPVYDQRGRIKLSNEVIEIRTVFDDKMPSQVSENEWFLTKAKEIKT